MYTSVISSRGTHWDNV